MFVIMGHTRGDELIRPEAKPLFADPDRSVCEAKLAELQRERAEWLAEHENELPEWAQCAVYSRFEIVETAFPATAARPYTPRLHLTL